MLMDKGFITPVSIHYVRNHGAVPRLDWDSHKVKVRIDFPLACAPCRSANYSGKHAPHNHTKLSSLKQCCA